MSVAVLGIGTALPRYAIAQAKAAEIAKCFYPPGHSQASVLPALYLRTGVRTRASVLLEGPAGSEPRQSFYPAMANEGDAGPTTQARMERYVEEAPALTVQAAQRALAAAQVEARQITHILTVSCTGVMAPGVDIALIKRLGLPRTVGRTHIGFMGCQGALNAMRAAAAFVRSDPSARVLLCAVELCSLHYHYGADSQRAVANALFADGAAAMVLGSTPEGSSDPTWRVSANGACLFPDSEDGITWRVGDHGFTMSLSPQVPSLIAAHLRPWLESWLAENQLSLPQISSWAVHPGGPRILNAVVSSLGIPREAVAVSRQVLAECGNMSSPTVLFILERLIRAKAMRPCVALGFGPGLVAEAALLT